MIFDKRICEILLLSNEFTCCANSIITYPGNCLAPFLFCLVSLSKPSATQQQQISSTTRSITTTVSTPLASSPATAISSSGSAVQMTTPLNVVQKRTALQAQLAPPPPTSRCIFPFADKFPSSIALWGLTNI